MGGEIEQTTPESSAARQRGSARRRSDRPGWNMGHIQNDFRESRGLAGNISCGGAVAQAGGAWCGYFWSELKGRPELRLVLARALKGIVSTYRFLCTPLNVSRRLPLRIVRRARPTSRIVS